MIDIRAATKQLSPEDAAQLGATLNPYAFQTVADGVTSPVQAGACKATSLKRLPNTWAVDVGAPGAVCTVRELVQLAQVAAATV